VLNSLFVLLFLVLFALVIYPMLWQRQILVRPLARMGCGSLFLTMSFFCAGLLQVGRSASCPPLLTRLAQVAIDRSSEDAPDDGRVKCVVVNTSPCDVFLRDPNLGNRTLPSGSPLIDYLSLPIEFHHATNCTADNLPYAKFAAERVSKQSWISGRTPSTGLPCPL